MSASCWADLQFRFQAEGRRIYLKLFVHFIRVSSHMFSRTPNSDDRFSSRPLSVIHHSPLSPYDRCRRESVYDVRIYIIPEGEVDSSRVFFLFCQTCLCSPRSDMGTIKKECSGQHHQFLPDIRVYFPNAFLQTRRK